MTKWPEIPYASWKDTGASIHMWLQIIGKFRLAHTPWLNHSWQATVYVTGRGLTTALVPGRTEDYTVDLDLLSHEIVVTSTSGASVRRPLRAISVAKFHAQFVEMLQAIGAPTEFHGVPNEVPEAVPFTLQTSPGTYDPDAAQRWWLALVSINTVFDYFRSSFLGKSSPVHLFWGSLDLAVTRFSGRTAPAHPGGIPNLPDQVTREAYSHEVSSAGFWAGGGGLDFPAFYSYAYPDPEGFRDYKLSDPDAYFDEALGEFILPYDAVRCSADPDAKLVGFLEETYRAAAETAGWERGELECAYGIPRVPRHVSEVA